MPLRKTKWTLTKDVAAQLGGGLRADVAKEQLNKNEFADVRNVMYQDRMVQVDTGLTLYRNPVRGIPQKEIEFRDTQGIKYHLLVTTQTVYKGSPDNTWIYVSDGTVTSTAVTAKPGGTNVIDLTSAAGFTVGKHIGVLLDNGAQWQTQIATVSTNQITTTTLIPSGRTVPLGAEVVRAVELNGILDYTVNFVEWPASDWLIFTNGVDPIKKFTGSQVIDLAGLSTVNVVTARKIIGFHGHLLLFDTTESSGIRFPHRVRRSNGGNPEVYNAGTASVESLIDTNDTILECLELGPYLILYREKTIMRGSYTGDANQLIFWEYMVRDKGIISQQSVVNLESYHVFGSPAGIFIYKGGIDTQSIGDKIFNRIFSHSGDLNTPFRHRSFMLHVESLNEIWWIYPSKLNQDPDTILRYDLASQSYWLRSLLVPVVSGTFYVRENITRWIDLVGSWLEQRFRWNSRSITANAPIVLLNGTDGQVYEYDYNSSRDNGALIPWHFITKTYTTPDTEIFVDKVIAFGRGSNILVDYSPNGGETWHQYGVLNFGTSMKRRAIEKQITVDSLTLRFSGDDPLSRISWFAPEFDAEVAPEQQEAG